MCIAWCALVGASWLVYVGRRVVVCIAWCGRGRGGRAGGRARGRADGRTDGRRECKLKAKTPHHDVGNNHAHT